MERLGPAPDAGVASRDEPSASQDGSGEGYLATFQRLVFGNSTNDPLSPPPSATAQQLGERAGEGWAERQADRLADRSGSKQAQNLTQRPPAKPVSPINRPPPIKPPEKSRAPRTPPRSKAPRAQSEGWSLVDLVAPTPANTWIWNWPWARWRAREGVGISAKLSDDHEVPRPSEHPEVALLAGAWGPNPPPVRSQSGSRGLQRLQLTAGGSARDRSPTRDVGISAKLSDEDCWPGPSNLEGGASKGAKRSASLGFLPLKEEDFEAQLGSKTPDDEAEEATDDESGGPSLVPVLLLLALLWVAAMTVGVALQPKGVGRLRSLLRGEEFDEDAAGGFVTPLQFQERAAQLARNGTIVLLVVNSGYLDFFHNWVLHARDVGLEGHFVAVLEDEASLEFVRRHWPGQGVRVHVPQLETAESEALRHEQLQNLAAPFSGTAAASEMDAPAFRMMMYRRLFYIRLLLSARLDVLLCDVDVVFLKDPLPHFRGRFDVYGVLEIQDGVHWYDNETVPLERGSSMYLNAGFLYFRPHLRTFLLLDFWVYKIFRAERKTGIENDQIYLRFVIMNLSFLQYAPRVAVVPQKLFPPGWLYFGRASWRKDHVGEVVTVHNNWIRSRECKMMRWLQHGLWRLPGTRGAIPNITLLDSSNGDEGRAVGIRGVNWTFQGVPADSLPWNASECRVGTGLVHPNELKQWN